MKIQCSRQTHVQEYAFSQTRKITCIEVSRLVPNSSVESACKDLENHEKPSLKENHMTQGSEDSFWLSLQTRSTCAKSSSIEHNRSRTNRTNLHGTTKTRKLQATQYPRKIAWCPKTFSHDKVWPEKRSRYSDKAMGFLVRSSNPGRRKRSFSSSERQHRLWSPSSLLLGGYWDSFPGLWPGSEANYSPPSSAKVTNEWSYTSFYTPCMLSRHEHRRLCLLSFWSKHYVVFYSVFPSL